MTRSDELIKRLRCKATWDDFDPAAQDDFDDAADMIEALTRSNDTIEDEPSEAMLRARVLAALGGLRDDMTAEQVRAVQLFTNIAWPAITPE